MPVPQLVRTRPTHPGGGGQQCHGVQGLQWWLRLQGCTQWWGRGCLIWNAVVLPGAMYSLRLTLRMWWIWASQYIYIPFSFSLKKKTNRWGPDVGLQWLPHDSATLSGTVCTSSQPLFLCLDAALACPCACVQSKQVKMMSTVRTNWGCLSQHCQPSPFF